MFNAAKKRQAAIEALRKMLPVADGFAVCMNQLKQDNDNLSQWWGYIGNYAIVLKDKSFSAGTDEAYLGLSFGDQYMNLGLTVKVVKGYFETVAEAEAEVLSNPSLDITSSIWDQSMSTADSGYPAYYYYDVNGSAAEEFTVILYRGSEAIEAIPLGISIWATRIEATTPYRFYLEGDTSLVYSSYTSTYEGDGLYAGKIFEYVLDTRYLETLQYNFVLMYTDNYDQIGIGREKVLKAVVGHYLTVEDANGQPDIKDQLFPTNPDASGAGYKADYSGEGITFSIFPIDGTPQIVTVKAVRGMVEPQLTSADTYFHVTGAQGRSDVYVMPYEHDTYYTNGFQTVFVLDPAADLSALKPTFWKGDKVSILSTQGGTQTSGSSVQDFSAGPVQYSASAEDARHLKNYWVTFVKQQTDGACLYVNGINGPDGAKREVFLNTAYNNRHDIFIANIGNAPLTGLSVTYTSNISPTIVKLDDYWTINGNNNALAAFTTVADADGSYMGELPNVAKIRLLPTGVGEIDGTLTISADGQEDVVIAITGVAGNPKIATASLPSAVKYVPYSSVIQTTNMYGWNLVSFEITDGELPEGMILKSNGEIYGVPRETGSFTFTVKMSNSYTGFPDMETASFTLFVAANTNVNVSNMTDVDYNITTALPGVISTYQNYDFVSEGEYAEFVDFWLDGVKLTDGVHYDSAPGSTKITIRAQTIEDSGEGTHTIAAEFRVDGDESKELKRSAQNYTLDLSGKKQENDNGGRNDSGDSGSAGAGFLGENGNASNWNVNASLSTTAATFSQNPASPDYADIIVTLNPGVYQLNELLCDGKPLQYGDGYTSSGNVFTLTKEFLSTLDAGIHTFLFDMNGGADAILTVAVFDMGNGIPYLVLSAFGVYTGNGTATVRIDADFESFEGLLYEGNALDPANYTAVSGSTVITLHEEFLCVLANGMHMFRAMFTDGYADIVLIVDRTASGIAISRDGAGSSGVPQTGDIGNVEVWAFVFLGAVLTIAAAAAWRRVQKIRGTW